jgi:hypothetical protein
MAVQFDFPQNADPSKFSAADWQRAGRRAKTTPSAGSVSPVQLSTDTTDLIDTTAQSAATAAADAAKAQAIAESNASASNLAAAAETSAVATAAQGLANHVADTNPHPQYLTEAEGDTRYQPLIVTLTNAVDDAAAATAGVAVGKLYRNGSIVMIRVA